MQKNLVKLKQFVFFSNSNVKGTEIDCSMCSTILPSGDSLGTTLEVPRMALLHRSKLQCSDAANSQYLSKNIKYASIMKF